MTQSDEELDAELQPWNYKDIVSYHYEYPDEEDLGCLTQDGGESYGGDTNMYCDDGDYEYISEGDGAAIPRMFL